MSSFYGGQVGTLLVVLYWAFLYPSGVDLMRNRHIDDLVFAPAPAPRPTQGKSTVLMLTSCSVVVSCLFLFHFKPNAMFHVTAACDG